MLLAHSDEVTLSGLVDGLNDVMMSITFERVWKEVPSAPIGPAVEERELRCVLEDALQLVSEWPCCGWQDTDDISHDIVNVFMTC